MIKKLVRWAFALTIVGLILLIMSLVQLSYLNGIGGLVLYMKNPNAFMFQYVLFTLLQWWGAGSLVVGVIMGFLSIYPFDPSFNLTKLRKYGENFPGSPTDDIVQSDMDYFDSCIRGLRKVLEVIRTMRRPKKDLRAHSRE